MAWYNSAPALGGAIGGILGGAGGAVTGAGLGLIKTIAGNPFKTPNASADVPDYTLDPNAFDFNKQKIDFSNDPFRSQQMTLADALAARAYGQGPSIADEQAKLARQSLFSQGLSALSTQRGGNTAMGQRSLFNALAQGNQGIGAQAGIQRLQEQQAAASQLGGLLQGGRQQDLASRLAQLDAQKELQLAKEQQLISRGNIRAGLAGGNADRKQKNNAAILGLLGAGLGAGISAFGGK